MRIPLPTDIKTRTGAPSDKDARQKNSYVETRGEDAIVRKRPSAQGGIPIGTGVAQGGIGLNINGTPYFIGFWDDTMQAYTGGGSTWDAGTSYLVGGAVWIADDENAPFNGGSQYYALLPNSNKNPKTNPYYWTTAPIGAARYQGYYPFFGGSGNGDIAGSIESAGYSAWVKNEPFKSCATKSVSQSWFIFAHVLGGVIYISQWSDVDPFNCSLTPFFGGTVKNVGSTVTTV